MFSNKKNTENLELWYKEMGKLVNEFSLDDNKTAVQTTNLTVKNYLDRHHINTYFFGSTQTALELAKSYGQILAKFSKEAEEVNFPAFIKAFKTALLVLKDPILISEIRTALDLLVVEKQRAAAEQSRQARIHQHQQFTIQCFTLVAYGLYIDIISSLVPMSPVRIPSLAILSGLLAGAASQYTAGYRSQEELMNGFYTIGDSLLNSSGLRYCYRTLPSAVERLALTLADNVQRGANAAMNALPSNNPPNVPKLKNL